MNLILDNGTKKIYEHYLDTKKTEHCVNNVIKITSSLL